MKAKIYIGAKKYALYIGRKIIEKTLEFLTLPARFVSNKVQELKNLTMLGNSVQNGTPTPTAPIEIESVGDKTNNLFDGEWEYGNIDADGNVIISTSRSTWIHGKNRIKVKPNTRYWFRFFGSVTRTNAQFYVISYDKDDKFIAGKRTSVGFIIANVNGSYYDMASNVEYIRLFYYHNVEESTSLDTNRYKLSIEERSDVISSYEPYGYKIPVTVGDITTNIYLDQPLRKIGEYADTLSVDGTAVTVMRNIKEIVLDGSENYTRRSDVALNYSGLSRRLVLSGAVLGLCDRFECIMSSSATSPIGTLLFNPKNYYLHFFTEFGGDVDAFKNWLTTNNVTIDYVLETPITETYTIENSIQLEQGTLTIDTDTNIKPSKIEITGDIDNE